MLSSEFSVEMGALIRSLQDRIQKEADLSYVVRVPELDHKSEDIRADLDRAIIRLIALRLSL